MDGYDAHARERLVPEPPKRVEAPERTPFERDRARVVHCASSRRLAAKTQVMGPQSDDFVRNRLTHSLEVAQVARDLARALGCHPDIAETAALAHDLGHPPFGHNGERVLNDLMVAHGGFEGNAQTLRILTRLEAKTFDGERSAGLNLTRATLDACTKYPWRRDDPQGPTKFGVYDDDLAVFGWLRDGVDGVRRCLEAQVMDLADDVAYSVHDVEDGIVAGMIDLSRVPEERAEVWATVRGWYLPDVSDAELDDVLGGLQRDGLWAQLPYDGSRRRLAALKNLTSDLIGRFCGAVQQATFAVGRTPVARYGADLEVPRQTWLEISLLKGVAAHYVMATDVRQATHARQADLLNELFSAVAAEPEQRLDVTFAQDFAAAGDDAARHRVIADQIASLTDASAVSWHARWC
ncbi:deoxyguanosinetriphosphate triphosphohydrolase [Nocardioides limicola]|uniref:deoxyguanosinetriphosphate triphosphohydrolase n=1 Tax=Nocardioides limicola TaxID=2803368 RepID=UPI00193B05D4|nr:deoxyguanosinetriphosphate triphosphohydrolase [Nocardioides sp. DJM-14]